MARLAKRLLAMVAVMALMALAGADLAGAATWHFENLDGVGAPTNGRVNGTVGLLNNAVLYGAQPHAFYYDGSHGTVRHAWWTGSTWMFETLDGPGSAYAGAANHFVGNDANPAVVFGSQLHVFYNDQTTHALRHAW